MIDAGVVLVEGRTSLKASQEAEPSRVALTDAGAEARDEVSRAQRKLAQALEAWPDLQVSGVQAVDVGASTGGFTRVLLDHGASRVWAVDVGHDQLDASVAADPRVENREGVNARDVGALEGAGLGQGVAGLVVCDVSFISLVHVLGSIRWLLQDDREAVVLVKPQFEVGPGVSRNGVVRRGADRQQAVSRVLEAAGEEGLRPVSIVPSRTVGTHGNVEFILRTRAGEAASEVVGGAWHSGLPHDDDFWSGDDVRTADL